MWKVWVVSHYLSTKDRTRMALADFSGSKWMISLKPAARMWALVFTVWTLFYDAIWLLLPLPKNRGKV